jgi:hypothetical protein
MVGQNQLPDIAVRCMEPSNNNPMQGVFLDSAYDPATNRINMIRVGGMDIMLHIAIEFLKLSNIDSLDEPTDLEDPPFGPFVQRSPDILLLDPKSEQAEALYERALQHAEGLMMAYRKHLQAKQRPSQETS